MPRSVSALRSGAAALGLQFGVAALLVASGLAPATAAELAQKRYHIAAGPLGQALATFAAEAGVPLSFDAALADGKRSSGLDGEYSVEAGFAALLAGNGLRAVRGGDGGYSLETLPLVQAGVTELQAVKVSATTMPATTEGTGSYTARAVTIGKAEQKLREIPQSVSVVTRQQMDDRNVVTLEDAVRFATGVTRYSNHNSAAHYSARGGALDLQYDGVPGGGSQNGNPLDMVLYDHVEVLRGPSGLLQGSANSGGSINRVRKRALDQFSVGTTLNAGSWSNYRGVLDITGPLNAAGTLRGRAIFSAQDREFFYDRADSRTLLGSGLIDFDPVENLTLGVAYTVQDTDIVPYSGFPGRQQLDDQRITTFEEALAQLPGVTVAPLTGGWGNTAYSVRGHTLGNISVDGSPSRGRFAADSSFDTGMAKYDNIQLLRGPDGLFSGNGQPSGTINLVRKRSLDTFQLKTALSAGSWNNYLGEVDVSVPLTSDGRLRGRSVVSYNDTKKFYDYAHRKSSTVYGVIDFDVSEHTSLGVGLSRDKNGATDRTMRRRFRVTSPASRWACDGVSVVHPSRCVTVRVTRSSPVSPMRSVIPKPPASCCRACSWATPITATRTRRRARITTR